MKQTCGNCKWVTFEMSRHNPPRHRKDSAAKCNWPVPDIPLPISVQRSRHLADMVFTSWVSPSDANCPTWEAKPMVILEEAKP